MAEDAEPPSHRHAAPVCAPAASGSSRFVRAPPFAWSVTALNSLQRFCRTRLGVNLMDVPETELLEALRGGVKAVEGVEAVFGPQHDVEHAATLLARGLNAEPLSLFGRQFLRTILLGLAKTRWPRHCRAATMRYVVANPASCTEVLAKPIFILGLPRTASTLLYNLLALDPNARAPRQWEMSPFFDLFPLATRDGLEHGTDPRIEQTRRSDAELDAIALGFNARVAESHPSDPTGPDEDIYALAHQMLLSFFLPITGPAYQDWMLERDGKDAVYLYHKRFLQMLQSSWAPASHWVLKTPEHAIYNRSLLAHFPDARIVVTHRALEFVLPSMCRLWETIAAVAMDDGTLDRLCLGELACRLADVTLEGMHELRASGTQCDVLYDDMVRDPVGVVRRIYAHFGLRFSQEHEGRIRAFMQDNPQGKRGRAPYTLEEYGLDLADIRKRYASYEQSCLHTST